MQGLRFSVVREFRSLLAGYRRSEFGSAGAPLRNSPILQWRVAGAARTKLARSISLQWETGLAELGVGCV